MTATGQKLLTSPSCFPPRNCFDQWLFTLAPRVCGQTYTAANSIALLNGCPAFRPDLGHRQSCQRGPSTLDNLLLCLQCQPRKRTRKQYDLLPDMEVCTRVTLCSCLPRKAEIMFATIGSGLFVHGVIHLDVPVDPSVPHDVDTTRIQTLNSAYGVRNEIIYTT